MKKTYNEFLDELSEFYTVGSEVELDYLEFTENQELYKAAQDEGYIRLMFFRITTMLVIKLPVPYLSHDDVIAYFN